MARQGDPELAAYGYYFYPREYPDAAGHPRLDIWLRSTPSGRHFDPEQILLLVSSGSQGVDTLKVRHPWDWGKQYRACAGRVMMHDRKHEAIEAFTFGGDVHIESKDTFTMLSLTSPAPILELQAASSMPELLAEETEIIIAERRASWGDDHAGFENRISVVPPLTLYQSCLQILREKFEGLSSIQDESVQEISHFIRTEIETLRELDRWPTAIPSIDELL